MVSVPQYRRVRSTLEYPITYVEPPTPIRTPVGGESRSVYTDNCAYMRVLAHGALSRAQKQAIIENHDVASARLLSTSTRTCDADCDNLYLQQLYESFLAKYLLENEALSAQIMDIYDAIFEALGVTPAVQAEWAMLPTQFPVNQKGRDWASYMYPRVQALADLDMLDGDATQVLLGADLLKFSKKFVDAQVAGTRDYVFNNILKRVRGYRTNQANCDKRTNFCTRSVQEQAGIASFDLDALDLDVEPRTYVAAAWMHPGRSQCATNPLQGMYQHSAWAAGVPIECSVSGSTNFWTWTALFSQVNMSVQEVRLFLLSAFMVLNADGGHSLMEVLSSATLTAIVWRDYLRYSEDRSLEPYLRGSNFAENLYVATRDINPVGSADVIAIQRDDIADKIFNSDQKYFGYAPDSARLSDDEKLKRQQLEAYFAAGRQAYAFGNYSGFLNKIPQISTERARAINALQQYVYKYCVGPERPWVRGSYDPEQFVVTRNGAAYTYGQNYDDYYVSNASLYY